MATNGGQIKFGVGFNVDKSGLNDLKKSLQELRNMKLDDFDLGKKLNTKDANNKLLELKRTVHGVENALKESFNADLGTLNVTKLNSELKKIGIDKIRNDFYDMGAAGQNAFRNLATEALTTNRQLKQTHNIIDKMAETLGNTLKWNISSGAINRMSGAIQEAYGFTKSLDSSLNDIMIVTGKNADEMERFAQKANQAAKSLASGTTDYTKASLIYYQQGLSDQDSAARAETTLKVANVTGQSADAVSEQLTAVWNGYKVSAEEAELYIDKLSAVAADTAADLDGLSTGMSKVASAANLMGVDIDQLNATLATVVSVTQQAPESIGTAFKTIYARMGDIEAGLDTETTLGEYTKKMKEIGGISVLDENNQLREMGDVIEEVGSKWGSLSKEQQVALSQVMAGTRQYNNLLALFDNWDMYTDALNTSANAAGTLQEQQDIYMESTEAHLQQMRTSFEDLYMSLFDAETINDFADAMTTVVEGLTNFVDALGGGQGILNTFGTLATRVFSKNIAQGIATTITNLRVARENASATRAELELTEGVLKGDKVSDENLKMLVEWKKEILGFGSLVSDKQNEQANAIIKTTNELMNQKEAWSENLEQANNFLNQNTRANKDVKIDFKDFGNNDEEKDKAEKALKQIENRIKHNSKALDNAKGKIKKYYKTFEEVETGKKSFEEEAAARQEANKEIDKSIKALINQNQNIKLSEEAQNELNIALEEYRKALESNDQSAILNSGNKVLNIYSKINKDIENGTKHTRKAIEEEANGASKKIQEKIDETENGFKKFIKDLKLINIIKGFIDLTAGIGQVASGVQTLVGITDIWNNQELTAGEKFIQITSALSMGLGSIVSGATAVWPVLQSLIAKYLGVAASEVSVATAASTMWTAITGPIGLVIAGIAAVGVAIYALVKAHNAEIDAALEAKKNLEETKKAAEETKKAFEDLANSFNAYNDAVDKLKELKTGTEEYTEALEEANEKAYELIKTNSDLAKYAYRDEKGLVQFGKTEEDKEKVQGILKSAELRANNADSATNAAQIHANQTQLKADRKSVITEGLKYQTSSETGQAQSWAYMADEQLQDIINLVIEHDEIVTDSFEKEALKILDNNEKLAATLYDSEGQLKDSIVDLAEKTENLSNVNKLLIDENVRNNLENQEDYANLGDSEKEAFAKIWKKNEADYTDEELEDLREEAKQKVIEETEYSDGILGTGDQKGLQKEYADKMGYTFVSDNFGDKGTYIDTEGKEVKVDDETALEYLTNLKYAEMMGAKTEENELAYNNLMDTIEKTGEAAVKSGEKYGTDFTSVFMGAVSDENHKFDLSSIFQDLNLAEATELKDLSQEEFLEMMGLSEDDLLRLASGGEIDSASLELLAKMGFNTEDLKKAGADFAKDLYEGWQEGLNAFSEEEWLLNDYKKLNQKDSTIDTAREEVVSEKGISEETRKNLENDYGNEVDWDEFDRSSSIEQLKILNELQNENNKLLLENYDSSVKIVGETRSEEDKERLEEEKARLEEDKARLEKMIQEEGSEATKDTLQGSLDIVNELLEKTEQQLQLNIDIDATQLEIFENVVDNIVTKSSLLKSAAEMIGEGFLVAKEDAAEFAKLYPELLDSATVLADGQIQLNEQVVQTLMNGNADVINQDKEKTAELLENKIKLLNAEIAHNNIVIENLKLLLEDKISQEDAFGNIKKSEANFESQIQEGLTNEQLKAYDQLMKGNTDSTNLSLRNLDEVGNRIAKVSEAYSRMLTGEQVKYIEGGMTAFFEDTSKYTSTFNSDDYEDVEFNGESVKALLDNYEKNNELLTKERASYVASLSELRGSTTEATNAANSAASGKGGKAGNEKAKDPEFIEYKEKEVDLYREVNLELAKQEKLLSKLQKEQDKLNGKELIDNLNEQLEVIEQQKQALIEKAAIARKEAQTHRDSLESQGVQFDEEGYITNYDEMLKYKEDYLKRVTEKYNSLTEAEQKNYKKYLDEAETDYENFKNSMDRYTDIISEELPGYIEEFEDKLDEEIEINISKFNYEVEISLDLSNAKRQWNEFTRDVFLDENDTVGISNSYLKDMETYEKDAQDNSKQAAAVQKELEIINAGGYSEFYGTDAKKAEEDLLKYQEGTIAAMRGAKETAEQSRQLWLSGIDDSISELNESAEVYETLDSLYNHDMNMVNMLYGEDEYEKIDNIYNQKQSNDLEEIDNIKKRAEYYEKMMNAETDPEAKEKWKKAWLSTINELTSKTEEAVKTVLDRHANAVKKTVEEMNEKILPKDKKGMTMDLDLIGEEWDLIRESGERYLDDIEVGFEIQDFQNSFEDAFDVTDSIAGQNKLNKVYQEQLDILKDKDKLSQYDLDRAQAMLDITLKEIALEEARQNKSSMRLRRDAQGNYSYQYVEDEEATKDAERDLQDAQKGLYQLDKEKYLEDVQYVYDKTKELEDKIIELYNDTTLTNEEREQKKALLIGQYAPQIEEATKKVEESKVNLGNSTKIAMGAIGDEIVKDFVGSEGVGTLPEMESGMAQFVENISKEGGMRSILETTFSNLETVLDNTEQSIKDIETAAGEDFDAIGTNASKNKSDVNKLKNSVNSLKTNLDKLIDKEKDETEALKDLHLKADQRLNDLIGTESQIRKNTEAMQEYINKLKESRLEETKEANLEKKDPSDTPKKNPSPNAKQTPPPKKVPVAKNPSKKDNASKTEKAIRNGKIEIGDQVMFNGKYYYDTAQYVPGTAVRQLNLKDNDSRDFSTVLDYRPNETHPVKISFPYNVNPNVGWVQKEDIFMYKTGGLVDKTGPAWLDGTKSQPELVLNSKDTQNLLDTIKILRNADSLANSLNRSMSERMEARLNTEFKRLSNMMDIIKIERESGKDSLEQNVHIDADFPNVSDSNEIEQALMNLVNVASQYAYRR